MHLTWWFSWVNESVSVNHILGLVRLRVLSMSIQAICEVTRISPEHLGFDFYGEGSQLRHVLMDMCDQLQCANAVSSKERTSRTSQVGYGTMFSRPTVAPMV